MDNAARVTQSPFSRSTDDARARFEQAARLDAAGVDPMRIAELLLEGVEPEDLFGAPQWASLPSAVRVEASLQAAWVGAERDDEELSLDAATRALDLEPADERALAFAEPLWLERECFTELAARYSRAAATLGDGDRARHLLERAIHLLQDAPTAMPARVGLDKQLARLKRETDVEDADLTRLQSGGSEANAALSTLAERWLKDGRAREGVEALPRDLTPFHGEASLDLLERLFDQADDVPRLTEVLRKRVTEAPDAQSRGRALDKLAQLEHDRRGDLAAAAGAWLAAAQAFLEVGERDDAERSYERLLAALPEHLNAAARLVELRASFGDFAGVPEVFAVLLRTDAAIPRAAELLLGIAADAERACAADDFSELVDSVRWRLGADDQALAESLLRASARLFAAQDRDDDAAEIYRRLIAEGADDQDLRAFQALIDESPGSDWRHTQRRWLFEWRQNHDDDQTTVLMEWAAFEERDVGDLVAAAEVLTRAAELEPERADIWLELARLRLAGGDGEGGLRAAEQLRRLGYEIEPALAEAVLEHDPSARWAVDRLKITLSAGGRFQELMELYDRAIADAPNAEERARWLDEAAIAARDVAQDRARAVHYWEAFVRLVPDDTRVDLALERLYEQTGEHFPLLAHLERRLVRSTPEQQVVLEQRIARLALGIGAVSEALAAAERLRDLDAGVAQTLLQLVFTRCAQSWAMAEARGCGKRSAQLLRESYAREGRREEVARVLRAELELELDFSERCTKLDELASWCEGELGDLPGAFEAARLAFLGTLAEPERARLERLAAALGDWAALVDILLDAADSELVPDARRGLLQRAAEIARERRADEDGATRCYEALFAVEPGSALRLFAALGSSPDLAFEGLCRALFRAGLFQDLGEALRERAEATQAPSLYSRLARLQAEQLEDLPSAIDSYVQAGDPRAAAQLFLKLPSVMGEGTARALALAGRLGDDGLGEEAVRVLRHQLDVFGEQFPASRKKVQLALARAMEALGPSDPAQELLSQAVTHYPTDAEVLWSHAASAAARHDWDLAEQGYRTLLLLLHGETGRDSALKRTTVYVELASLKLQRGDEAAATQLLESSFEAALGQGEELEALLRALVAHALWEPAARAAAELQKSGDAALATALGSLPPEKAQPLLTRLKGQLPPL